MNERLEDAQFMRVRSAPWLNVYESNGVNGSKNSIAFYEEERKLDKMNLRRSISESKQSYSASETLYLIAKQFTSTVWCN